MRRSFFMLFVALPVSAMAEPRLALTFPVDCRLGETCVIQNFVDRDPGAGWRDYACGALTYDGHDGTDIRLRTHADMRAGVAVLAAADGRVTRTRDIMPDVSIRADNAIDLDRRDCGNAIFIEHANGWTTQYCHLKRGSVLPLPGDRVKAGQKIADIGLSGRTEFPHLHITVRHDNKVVDPQAPDLKTGACGAKVRPLWKNVGPDLLYRDAFSLTHGFADRPVQRQDVEDGATRQPDAQSAVLIAYVQMMGLRSGDRVELVLAGPGGDTLAEASPAPLETPKAAYWLSAGKRRVDGTPWPPGRYEARYSVVREGKRIRDERFFLDF